MLKFSLFRIPISVYWWFWLSTVLLGNGLSINGPDDWLRIAIWTGVVFVSIIVHELGHALAGRKFGAYPSIHLHGFGGTTYLPGGYFTRRQSILVSAAGPLAGLCLGLIVLGIARFGVWPRFGPTTLMIRYALYVNFFWTFINLLPIQPLDGGQILREALGPSRRSLTAMIGGTIAVIVALYQFYQRDFYLAIFMGLLAYYNFNQRPVEGGVIRS